MFSTRKLCIVPNLISIRVRKTENRSFDSKGSGKLTRVTRCLRSYNIASFYPASVALPRRRLATTFTAVGSIPSTTKCTRVTNVRVRNPCLSPRGGKTRGTDCLRTPSTTVFQQLSTTDKGGVHVVAVTPRLPNSSTFVQRFGSAITVSLKRSATSCRVTRGTFTTNTGRIARLFGTVPPLRRHSPNVVNTTTSYPRTVTRVVYSNVRVRPSIVHGTFHVFNGSHVVLVDSTVHTANVRSNRCRLNKRPMVGGNHLTALGSKAVTNSTAGLFSYVGGTIRFNVPLNITIGTTAYGPTGDVRYSRRVNALTIKTETSVLLLSRSLGVMGVLWLYFYTRRTFPCGKGLRNFIHLRRVFQVHLHTPTIITTSARLNFYRASGHMICQ